MYPVHYFHIKLFPHAPQYNAYFQGCQMATLVAKFVKIGFTEKLLAAKNISWHLSTLEVEIGLLGAVMYFLYISFYSASSLFVTKPHKNRTKLSLFVLHGKKKKVWNMWIMERSSRVKQTN